MTIFCRYIIIFLFVVVLPQDFKAYAEEENPDDMLAYYLSLQTYRIEHSNINKLIEILDIKSGMTVLDIGTGTGQYAYKVAEALEGTGRVYATDINAELINYVTEEATRRGLSNIYPVLVNEDGVDEFYTKQNYDLILVFHLYFLVQNKISYFKEMKDLLNENGRLIVTHMKCLPRFFLKDFTDFNGLIRELRSEPETSPFIKNLRKSTRDLLKQNSNEVSEDLLKNAIVDDFNGMLSNRHFKEAFLIDPLTLKKEISFSSEEEKSFVNWSLLRLNKKRLDRINRKIGILNKLFIVQRFREYLYYGAGISPYESQDRCGRRKIAEIKSNFKQAGYRFEKEFYSIPFESGLVFTVANDGSEE